VGALALGRLARGAPKRQPNIIFILADDLGYGDVGCYGQKQIQTPRLDQMAAQGLRFTDHYAGSTVCAPSRFTLMTGYHIGSARVKGQGQRLLPSDVTVAELLKGQGYSTALIGKWGCGEEGTTGVPRKQGFDHFFGYLNQVHAHNYYPAWLWRDGKKVELDNEVVRPKKGYARTHGGASTKRVDYSHDLFASDALDWVRGHTDGPFFLYLAFTLPHANNEAGILKRHGMEVPDYGIYKDKDWPEAQKGHAAMITRLDRDVGRLLDLLRELGIAEETLVVFSSDNGPHREGGARPDFFDSNGPLRGIKRDLYEGGIRVPTLAWWPGTVKAGTTTGHPSAFWDFLPTACEVAGMDPPDAVDGISYLPTLQGKPDQQKAHKYLYWGFPGHGGKQAVRWGKWKAVRLNARKKPDGPLELYNLDTDMGETKNVVKEHPDIAEKMAAFIQEARRPAGAMSRAGSLTG
jgi:uncharacterized sulfatase